jgi:hypothetical protein
LTDPPEQGGEEGAGAVTRSGEPDDSGAERTDGSTADDERTDGDDTSRVSGFDYSFDATKPERSDSSAEEREEDDSVDGRMGASEGLEPVRSDGTAEDSVDLSCMHCKPIVAAFTEQECLDACAHDECPGDACLCEDSCGGVDGRGDRANQPGDSVAIPGGGDEQDDRTAPDAETSRDHLDARTDANGDANGDANADATSRTEPDADPGADSQPDTDARTDASGDASGDANADANGDANADANGDANADATSLGGVASDASGGEETGEPSVRDTPKEEASATGTGRRSIATDENADAGGVVEPKRRRQPETER